MRVVSGVQPTGNLHLDHILAEFSGQGFGTFESALGEQIIETLRPITTRLAAFHSDPGELDRILVTGAQRTAEVAAPTLDATYRAMGLR